MESTLNLKTPTTAGTISPVIHANRAGEEEVFLVASGIPGVTTHHAVESIYEQIVSFLHESGMETVHESIFGSLSVELDVRDARELTLRAGGLGKDGPVTYIEGHPTWGTGLAGVIVHAVSAGRPDTTVWTIRDGDVPCGRGWKKNGVTFLSIQNIHGLEQGPESINTPPIQTWRMIERVERILSEQGATYRDVVRTWFYLSRILDWYDDFNRVRSEKYRQFKIMPGPGSDRILLPASTGISGDNPRGAVAVMDLLAAVHSEDSGVSIEQMTNPRQKDAVQYGSAFSRGAFIRSPQISSIQVSGTAAIDETGRSLYPDDVRSQIVCTLDNVEALLAQKGAGLGDIAAATVFVKRPEDADLFREQIARRGLEPFPGVLVVADICREDLLFEIDAEVAYNSRTVPIEP